MAPIIDFTGDIDQTTSPERIILSDISTYTGVTVNSRTFTLVDVDGVSTVYTITSGSNTVYVPYTKDSVLATTLTANYTEAGEDFTITKVTNILVALTLPKGIYDMRSVLVNKNCTDACSLKDFIQNIELIDSFYQGALNLASTDIFGAQKNLDSGNYLLNNCDFECQI